MRTIVELDSDVARAVDQLRLERGLGFSEAVNTLIRRGLAAPEPRSAFRQRTGPLGLRIDGSTAEDDLDDPADRRS